MLESPEQKGTPSLKQLLKGVATNPILLGIITGTVFALLPVSLPAVATKTLNNLASVTTPLALLSIGASFEGAKAIKKLVPTLVAALLKTVGLAAVDVYKRQVLPWARRALTSWPSPKSSTSVPRTRWA